MYISPQRLLRLACIHTRRGLRTAKRVCGRAASSYHSGRRGTAEQSPDHSVDMPPHLGMWAGPPGTSQCQRGRCSSGLCADSPLQGNHRQRRGMGQHAGEMGAVGVAKQPAGAETHSWHACPPGWPTGWVGRRSGPEESWGSQHGSGWCRPHWSAARGPVLRTGSGCGKNLVRVLQSQTLSLSPSRC